MDDVDETIIQAGAIRAQHIYLNARLSNTSNLFLQVQINGYTCEAMIDNGATHNFITPVCAMNFGLKLQPLSNLADNFVMGFTNTCSIVEDVKVEAGDWKGRTTFLSVDMDNFDVILGLEWVDKYVISQFGKKVDKLLLDNEDGKGGVIVNMYRHKEERVTNRKARIASL